MKKKEPPNKSVKWAFFSLSDKHTFMMYRRDGNGDKRQITHTHIHQITTNQTDLLHKGITNDCKS